MIFIALQNNEKQYDKTRHNAGAILLSEIERCITGADAKFFYNDTFMNLSGGYVKKVLKQNNIQNNQESLKNVYIFFDDMNVPVGKYIISHRVGAASHNGIKSILASGIQNEFYRVRIGVGLPPVAKGEKTKAIDPREMSDFVLSKLTDPEIAIIKSLAKEVVGKLLAV
jgi:PTH1 family peptidyl-tRNA hydrolase